MNIKFINPFKLKSKLIFFPFLAVGILILIASIILKPKLNVETADKSARLVDVVPLKLAQTAPVAFGFGQVKPKHQWSAIAEVTGEITYKSDLLTKGKFILAGTELLRIDPLKYQLALAQAEADLTSDKLQLTKLEQEQINLAKNLKIEQNRLSLKSKESKRLTKLNKQGLIPLSDLENQKIQLLTQEKNVQELNQQLDLFENKKSVAVAKINLSTAKVSEAKRSLDKTIIKTPRNIIISQVNIEQNQTINLNQTMLTGHALEIMEVEAKISIHDMNTLISTLEQCNNCKSLATKQLNQITASIELSSGNVNNTWQATIGAISETIDINQASVGVILEIKQDPNKFKFSQPPLLNGMFVKATLIGKEKPQFSVPEKAIHTNRIYVMDKDQKLKIIPINVLYRNQSQTIIEGDLSENDKLVLNDLLPAVEGMYLKTEMLIEAQ